MPADGGLVLEVSFGEDLIDDGNGLGPFAVALVNGTAHEDGDLHGFEEAWSDAGQGCVGAALGGDFGCVAGDGDVGGTGPIGDHRHVGEGGSADFGDGAETAVEFGIEGGEGLAFVAGLGGV